MYAPKPLDVCVARLAKELNKYLVNIFGISAGNPNVRAIDLF